MTAKHDCSGKAWHNLGNWGEWTPCSRNATVQRASKWYCWQHDPERVEADVKKRRAGWEAKANIQTAIWETRARNAKLAALVTLELARLLDDLSASCDHSAWLAAERGWAFAASIREALEVIE